MRLKDYDVNKFIEDINEDFDVVGVSYESSTGKKNIDNNKIKEVKKSLNLIFTTAKKGCPNATLRHSIMHDDDDVGVKVIISTDSGDWLEADNKIFADCIKYASEFKISPADDEKMEINISFDKFTR